MSDDLEALIQSAFRVYGHAHEEQALVRDAARRDPAAMRACLEADPLIRADLQRDETDKRPICDRVETDDLSTFQGEPSMSLTVSEGAGSFELPPAGTYPARCYRIIDMGSQETDFNGEHKLQKKMLLQWELLGDERMADGRPYTVSKRYTASLHEKAQLRRDLESWRGRPFTAEELRSFELPKILGAHCLLSLIHIEKAGRTYCNLSAVMALPKGMPRPEGVNELLTLDLDRFDPAEFAKLSEGLQATIRKAPEFARVSGQAAQPAAAGDFADLEDVAF